MKVISYNVNGIRAAQTKGLFDWLQVVDADQESRGFNTIAGNDAFGTIIATPVTGGADYTDVLPTLNLSFEIAEESS